MSKLAYSKRGHVSHDVIFDGNATTVVTTEELTPLLDEVQRLREVDHSKSEFRPVAKIPTFVVEQAIREGWFEDRAAWKRWLNAAENRVFRIWQGAV